MEPDLAKDLEILTQVMRLSETHEISLKEALTLCIKKLKVKIKELEDLASATGQEGSAPRLKAMLTPEQWNFFMEKLKESPTSEELSKAYQHALANGKLKLARLCKNGDFHIRNSDFIGEKNLTAGSLIEVEVLDQQIGQVWLSPTECEYMFLDELEFI